MEHIQDAIDTINNAIQLVALKGHLMGFCFEKTLVTGEYLADAVNYLSAQLPPKAKEIKVKRG